MQFSSKTTKTNKLQLYDFEKGEVCLFLMSECEREIVIFCRKCKKNMPSIKEREWS